MCVLLIRSDLFFFPCCTEPSPCVLELWSRGRSTCARASGHSSASPAAASSECWALASVNFGLILCSVLHPCASGHSIRSYFLVHACRCDESSVVLFISSVYLFQACGISVLSIHSISFIIVVKIFTVSEAQSRQVLVSLWRSFICSLLLFWHIHGIFSREFTHRVKSVSMSTFTTQEVEALQNGGNQVRRSIGLVWAWKSPFWFMSWLLNWMTQRARESFLKEFDAQKMRLPDSR